MMFEIGIRCGHLMTMKDGETTIARDRFIGISGSKISEISQWKNGDETRARKFIDAGHKLVMPGLINGHTHLPMTLLRGLAEDQPFSEWLHKTILPIEGKLINPELVRIGSELALLESLYSGVTTICDMYYFEDVVADTVERAGMRGLVGEAIADFPTPDDKNLSGENYKTIERMIERFKGDERITVCVAPHAPYSCSDESLKKAAKMAQKNGLPILIHVLESKHELDESMKTFGKTPVQRLYDLGVMDGPASFAHCVWTSEEDMKLMAKKGTSAIYNPESNMKLGSGIAQVDMMLKNGVTVGIGTDGSASNNDLNIFHEMDSGAKLQKLIRGGNSTVGAREILNMGTLGGAKALGLGKAVGSIEVGKLADIIVLDLNGPEMQPIYNIPSQLVYASSGRNVETVICHGRLLMENSKPLLVDTARLFEEVRESAEKITKFLKT